MTRILSRMLTRLAIVLASLAWGGFVFTQTVGDPERGERIAAAVLEDDAARAEVVAPITASVMRSAGLPPEQQPLVATQIDALLQDPGGARTFIDPFAGSWARMLGEDDPRPAALDATSLLDDITAAVGASPAIPTTLPVTDVPLPRADLGWMEGVRTTVDAAVLPLALLAAALFAIALIIGERPRVLRRLGAWAFGAGLLWVVVPPAIVWGARRWAPGADSVVAAALDEAMSGLLPMALALVFGGVAAFGGSFVVGGVERAAAAAPPPPAPAVAPSAPVRQRPARGAATGVVPAMSPAATRTMPQQTAPAATPTPAYGVDATTPLARPAAAPVDAAAGDDGDSLWDYYSS
jgi:hypothetical protein